MNPAIIFPLAALILLAELPDKTMISTLLLFIKFTTLPVLLGTCCAFVIQSALASTIGGLLAKINHEIITLITSVLFLLGGLWLLLSSESKEEQKGQQLAQHKTRFHNVFIISFAVTFLGEIGDLTEIMTANFAASTKNPLSVFIGASLGLICFTVLASLFGYTLKEKLPLTLIRKLSGIILIAISIYSLLNAFKII
jgi:putative Ca2+/H+ antiporter (TMEM165/GDT1 family)